MRLADVRTVIGPGVDPDATYAAFKSETGDEAPERFLSYLKGKELVSDAQ